ncbi:type II toxin-antitoxin system PemK/MazF family toxin [Solitalea longa]|uniref:mRNA interferase n=1 Tax=Solitalea longa TaxID=2079460 RepID=A0A2S5A1R3_9SPHI|nr:type II toxin-antitoxin system PemK/MazF family toxin [Solitalea longa]
MTIKRFEIWLADLNPKQGTEAGKTRPVVIVQTDLLNEFEHPSTIICPITTNVQKGADVLRVHLPKGNLDTESDIMVDQIRAIDNKRFIKKLGAINDNQRYQLVNSLKAILDLL